MRTAIPLSLVLSFALSCEGILPVETVNLCEGTPPSTECPQCSRAPFAENCPQCRGGSPDDDCRNAIEGGITGVDDGGAGARDGGSGAGSDAGDGGGPCAMCTEDEHCLDELACVECRDDDDCGGATDRCSPDTHACVECVNEDDCGDSTPKCEDNVCVQCVTHEDCDAGVPVCGADNECGACSANTDCADRDATDLCDTRTESTTLGACVACLTHADCENPIPQCTNGECGPCNGGNGACQDREGIEICNEDEATESFGHCVECTGATEEARCDDKACKRSTGACTDVIRGMSTACKPCEADSECAGGARCVPHEFDEIMLGLFCFYDDGPSTNCSTTDTARRPYSQSTRLTSVDGVESAYCLPVSTCHALSDATAMGDNGGKPCETNNDCGQANLSDGYCPDSGSAVGKCSYLCDGIQDCPNTGFTACTMTGSFMFCQP